MTNKEEKYYTVNDNKNKELSYTFNANDSSLEAISTDLHAKTVSTIYKGQPDEYIKCPHCGELAKLDPQVYTSMPPQYGYHCSHCGKSGYIFCHEAHIIIDPAYKPWYEESKPSKLPESYTECLICGEKISVALTEPHTKICKNCKDAVIAMRKALGT